MVYYILNQINKNYLVPNLDVSNPKKRKALRSSIITILPATSPIEAQINLFKK